MKASLFHYQVKIHYQRKYWPFMYQSWDNCYGLLDLKQSINQSNHLCRNNINAWSIRGTGQYFVLRIFFLTFSFSQILHFELNHSYWASSVFSSVGYLNNECFLFSGNPWTKIVIYYTYVDKESKLNFESNANFCPSSLLTSPQWGTADWN